MKRKLSRKELAKLQLLWEDLLKRAGATESEHFMYPYAVQTRLGVMRLDSHFTALAPAIFCRFDDVEAACATLNPRKEHMSWLNPYSGKWNHHYPVEWTPEEIIADFTKKLNMVMGGTNA